MATLTFSYRSTKDKASLEARLSFRIAGANLNPKTGKEMPYSFYTRSKVEVTKDFWSDYQKGIKFKDAEKINLKNKVDNHTHDLRTHVLKEFEKVEVSVINKEWLKTTIHQYYNPPQPEPKELIPDTLISYIDYYIECRKHELSRVAVIKWGVIKNKLQRFEKKQDKIYLIKEVNEGFKKTFVEYYKSENYSQNTTQRELGFIKTLCRHARSKGVEVSPELETLSLKKEKVPKIYLDFKELQKIQELDNLPDYLDNARDWLVISCYTGQRISDFMRFDKSMIRIENEVPILEFTQVKTKTEMAIPVLPEVMAILDKRDGNFPRRISDQRYNEYIKRVCEKAELNKRIKGKTQQNISDDKDKPKMRNVPGVYSKYELVTSHIGRRSFATNFYGKLPTTFLIGITGHSTEKMFLAYIGKGQKDLAFDAYEYFKRMNEK